MNDEFKEKLKSIGFSKNRSTKIVVKPGLVETHHADGRIDAKTQVSSVTSSTDVNGVG